MKTIGLFVFLLPCVLRGQTDLKVILGDARLEKIKWEAPYYLAIFDNPSKSDLLKPYLLRSSEEYDYGYGLALMDKSAKIIWIYHPKHGHIVDMLKSGDTIFILITRSHSMKMDSKIALYEEKLNMNGEKISEKWITSLDAYCGGARINGAYSESGEMWTWSYWYGTEQVKIDSLARPSVEDAVYYIQLFDKNRRCKGHHLISGYQLEMETFACSSEFAAFILNGVSCSLDDVDNSELSGTRALMIGNNSEILKMEIFGKNIFPEHLAIEQNQLIMAGYFQGNDSVNTRQYSHISGNSLVSVAYKSGERARNGFIASYSRDLKLNWVKTLISDRPIHIRSFSVWRDTLAFSVEFRGEFVLDGQIVKSKKKREYDYTDGGICILDGKGKLVNSMIMNGNGYERAQIKILPQHIIYYGSFLKEIELAGEVLKYDSKNSVNFIMMQRH